MTSLRTAAAAGALLSSVAGVAAAQTAPHAAPLHTYLDASRVVATRDSFVIMANGRVAGSQRYEIAKLPKGWRFIDAVTLGTDVEQQSHIETDAQLREITLEQKGRMRNQPMAISLKMTGGRVQGLSQTPTSGPNGMAVNTEAPDGVVDDNAVVPLLWAMRWREGLDIRFPVISSGKGDVSTYRLRVIGADTTTVPMGHFNTWRAELEAERFAMVLHVTRDAPHRMVRISIKNAPMDMQRVK
ncbi:MAG: hypothetical protein IBJ03_06155 [Gemmatimonadaceae bacterium]|nr:hypothetical protein [Gemmatimonadaceae bacterium]